jgi:hypothetical protein
MLRFRQFLESQDGHLEPYPHEQGLLRRLFRMSVEDQLDADQSLHRSAMGKNTFGSAGSDMLAQDHDDKNVVRAALLGDAKAISQALVTLRRDLANHQHYLTLPPSETTGSHPWHKAWAQVYKDWLTRLTVGTGNAGIPNHSTVVSAGTHG